jgi:hypothetical protein
MSLPMDNSAPTAQSDPPKVFISYSWSNDTHIDWVLDLAERLMSDRIDVVIDKWSLIEGHDLHAFMEQMVVDPTIKRVLIISDNLYAEKANGRLGGVGKETQIISKEVYESVEQTKFVPILRERDADGKPCLPVYLQSRKYIDFSQPDNEPNAYDQLIRNIYERPVRPKPALGSLPTHIFMNDATVIKRLKKGKDSRIS